MILGNYNPGNPNELTSASRTGTLTVAGTTTSRATNVTVNSLAATLYADSTFGRSNFTLANGNNTFAAIAKDAYGRQDSQSITVNLPATGVKGSVPENGIDRGMRDGVRGDRWRGNQEKNILGRFIS
jgi:hypothetical protein